MENFYLSLELMGKGMLAIFVVMGIILLVVNILSAATKKRLGKKTEE